MREPADDQEGAPPTGEPRDDDARGREERAVEVRRAEGAAGARRAEGEDQVRGAQGGEAGGLAGRRWSLVAGLCLVAAAALWLLVGVDAAFFFATLGVLAWFWDQRNRIAARHLEAENLSEADTGEAYEDDADDDINADDDVSNEDDVNNEVDLYNEDDPGGVEPGGPKGARK